ncbi:hypothetical protein SAMN06265370_1411 [Puniceibacterium sediminis]|uniref:Uncharacterized protein n=1 Tax=Puniceibacterium sediminis TaxID=1608407 RepID=A0A238ZV00_9RHOB|nr:hypothetical protein SAMN06265370_1411 [Puniceibacterium sediminis]
MALLHKSVAGRAFPFPGQTYHGLCDGYAKSGVTTVEDGDADLDFRDLAVEVPRHEALPQQFHTGHLGFDAAPTVVSA